MLSGIRSVSDDATDDVSDDSGDDSGDADVSGGEMAKAIIKMIAGTGIFCCK